MSEGCFVYIIHILGSNLRKVGISSWPQGRLTQLCTGSPFEMRIEKTYPLPSRQEASSVEAIFHREKANRRSRGEWFDIDADSAEDGVMGAISVFLIETLRVSEDAFDQEMAMRGCDDGGCYFYEREAVAA